VTSPSAETRLTEHAIAAADVEIVEDVRVIGVADVAEVSQAVPG